LRLLFQKKLLISVSEKGTGWSNQISSKKTVREPFFHDPGISTVNVTFLLVFVHGGEPQQQPLWSRSRGRDSCSLGFGYRSAGPVGPDGENVTV